jgi:hypothetical protein
MKCQGIRSLIITSSSVNEVSLGSIFLRVKKFAYSLVRNAYNVVFEKRLVKCLPEDLTGYCNYLVTMCVTVRIVCSFEGGVVASFVNMTE